MRTRELHFRRAATVNLGNFENAKVEVEAIVELQEGDTDGGAFEKMTAWVNEQVRRQLRESVK